MKKLIPLLVCSSVFFSCKQLSKSIEETFNPKDTLASKTIVMKASKHSDASVSKDSVTREFVNTVIKTHAEAHSQSHTETHSSIHTTSNHNYFLTDTIALLKAEKALKELPQYIGKEIFVYAIVYFYENGSINTSLQHPENPKYVDKYDYKDGVWSGPKPEQLSVRNNVARNIFPLNQIRFTDVAKVARIYNEKAAGIEGAKPTGSIYITISDNQMRWFPSAINGSRERYNIQFNKDGTLKAFRQD